MNQSVRGAFEYQGQLSESSSFCVSPDEIPLCFPGQKCSALSRIYVSATAWNGGFKEQLLAEIAKLKIGPASDFTNFIGPVMYARRISSAASMLTPRLATGLRMTRSWATSRKLRTLAARFSSEAVVRQRHRGIPTLSCHMRAGDDSKGFFVQPTVILTKDPHSVTMVEEIFGPVITV